MSIKGMNVWALRSGLHYEGSTLAGLYETEEGAIAAALLIMAAEDENGREIYGEAMPWEYDDVDSQHWWDNSVNWLLIKQYEIE